MKLSPHFTLEDWNFGKCTDIDVAEDQLSGWIFEEAHALAGRPHSGIAVLTLVTPYFPLIQSYRTGESGRGRETEFLGAGLALVFPAVTPAARDAYVQQVPHGLLEGGLFRRALVHYGEAAFPDFDLLADGRTLSVNPGYVLKTAQEHCRGYFARLRAGTDAAQVANFHDFMSIRKKA